MDNAYLIFGDVYCIVLLYTDKMTTTAIKLDSTKAAIADALPIDR
ncbi:hypothetical protein OGM63_21750 [Plectonema radiosum NIES-515]|uniref:Uncharacterized protein n=1 Tax=Plectonema radiosum NIES-515 TaxID=2986073 RepID=A0ABT3B3Z5_9CYAN|nr:hypothetical protein [Plectonema radiosum]MCV3216101.1 hypothetical protein [Plectonema radiosum NIES-515]